MSWSLRFFQHSNIFPSEFGRFFSAKKNGIKKKHWHPSKWMMSGMCKFINWSPCIVFLPPFFGLQNGRFFRTFCGSMAPLRRAGLKADSERKGFWIPSLKLSPEKWHREWGNVDWCYPQKLGMHRVDGFKDFFCFFSPWKLGEWSKCHELFARASHFLGLQHLGGIFGIWKFMHKTHRGIVEMVKKATKNVGLFWWCDFFCAFSDDGFFHLRLRKGNGAKPMV